MRYGDQIVQKRWEMLPEITSLGQTWTDQPKRIVCSMGDSYQRLWEMQDIKRDLKALKFVSEILHRQFINKIMADIQTAGDGKKLRTYKLFKNEFCLEHYLLNISYQHYRCALAQYRLSSHNLGIETGRHAKPPTPPEKQCLYCDDGVVDDEIHILTKCTAHTDIRHRLTTNIEDCLDDYNCLPDVQKFISVMSGSNKVVMNELARFVHDAFNLIVSSLDMH